MIMTIMIIMEVKEMIMMIMMISCKGRGRGEELRRWFL